ncbi:MAG TPA: DUF3488 and transglutaminase-like domain-containing protein [Polyangiaceae bacterium]|nr:DUF3488 and transglutaminase-like domain-containing protein [Polyangiaceae bacterium]
MRFGLAHRLMTDTLAVLGALALVTSGKLHSLAVGLVLGGLVLALGLPQRYRQETFMRLMGVAAPLGIFGLQLARLSLGADPIPVIVEFAAALQVIRLATRRGAAHDHQVILLALLHLIAGTVLGGGLTYAVALVGFLVFTPGALVLSHLRREVEGNYRQGARDRTGMPVDVPRILRSRRVIGSGFLLFTCLLSLPVFAFTAVLFLAFPRVGFAWLTLAPIEPQRMVGFSDRVDLGGVGTIRTDPTLVMRVVPSDLGEDPALRRNLYLRGALFDSYDGRAWSRQAVQPEQTVDFGTLLSLRREPRRDTDRRWHIELEEIDPQVLFVPGDAVALEVTSRPNNLIRQGPILTVGSHGEIRYDGRNGRGIAYDLFLPPQGLFVPEQVLVRQVPRYLGLPDRLSPRVVDLALEWTSGLESAQDIAARIEARLREGYSYDLGSPSGKATDPLEHFLTVSKRGHCEFYSTAMAILLRVRGVPSRNVTGFVGGTYNRFGGFYAVRQGDAHSWVEAYLPERGWTRFDPTPPSSARPQGEAEGLAATLRELFEAAAQSWDENVVSFNLDKQMRLLRSVRQAFESERGPSKAMQGDRFADWRRWVGAGGVLLLVGVVWRLRRRGTARPASPERIEAGAQRSIELYRKLERALDARGVPRPVTTPPLQHALSLAAAGHPTGPEAVALTRLYLRARFGGRPLEPQEDADFLRRVAQLRRPEERQRAA